MVSKTTVFTGPDLAVPVGSTLTVWPGTPHERTVALTCYALADDIDQADSRFGVQVRVRGAGPDPRDALDLIDAMFDELHGATHLDLAGMLVHFVERTASAPMRHDENGRYEHADTYHLLAHRPRRIGQ